MWGFQLSNAECLSSFQVHLFVKSGIEHVRSDGRKSLSIAWWLDGDTMQKNIMTGCSEWKHFAMLLQTFTSLVLALLSWMGLFYFRKIWAVFLLFCFLTALALKRINMYRNSDRLADITKSSVEHVIEFVHLHVM